ncbi:MAG: tetratricopeptide repeat protein [Gammaproteobacteria bacterium]|nr:tetratricopeptide repeat protein [Gammaproteobacteria bacterium]
MRPRWSAPSLVVVGFLSVFNLAADNINQSHVVEDYVYGQALFEYFQGHELTSITHLLAAEQRAQGRKQPNESDLLLADLFYSYGLYEESSQLFSTLLSGDTAPALLNRVWFNLARLNHDQGYPDKARELLDQIDDRLPAHLQAEKQYLLTSLFLGEQQIDEAASVSQQINKESIWYAYAHYNLGINMLENADLDKGKSLLEKFNEIPVDSEELLALRDQANLSLGLSMLRNSQAEVALSSFKRVRLRGPFSHQALLGAGWAWNRLGQFAKALVPWLELAQKNTIDAATQEALLAIPTALEENQKPRLAVQYYQQAANQFDLQLKTLDEVVAALSRGELIDTLHTNALTLNGASFRNSTLQSNTAPYLHVLMASSDFYRALKRYHELIEIRATLNRWYIDLPVLSLMLAERRQRFQQKLPLLKQSTDFKTLETLTLSRNIYADQLQQIESHENYQALARVEEKEHLQRLEQVTANLDTIGSQRDTFRQRDMQRLFNGLLHWQIATDYAPRLWSAKKQLIKLDQALATAKQRADSIRLLGNTSSQHFDEFDHQINDKNEHISGLKQSVDNLAQRQLRRINKFAIAAIKTQQQHIVQLRLNTRYALARLYDSLVSEQ